MSDFNIEVVVPNRVVEITYNGERGMIPTPFTAVGDHAIAFDIVFETDPDGHTKWVVDYEYGEDIVIVGFMSDKPGRSSFATELRIDAFMEFLQETSCMVYPGALRQEGA